MFDVDFIAKHFQRIYTQFYPKLSMQNVMYGFMFKFTSF